MAWKVVFSNRSRGDLEKIVEYIARDNPTAAERFGLLLLTQAELLASTPEMGPSYRNESPPVGRVIETFRSHCYWHGNERLSFR
jgi:plasmid stabilization system protein ParE